MKKKIVIISIISLIVVGGIGVFFFMKNKESTSSTVKENIKVDDGDLDVDWDKLEKTNITLSKSLTISKEGVYVLNGSIKDGSITVSTSGNVKLILDNVNIKNSSGPAIIVEEAKNIVIDTSSNSDNYLEDGSNYTNVEYDGCIYSSEDLILQGSGKLTVISNYSDGIVSKDDLKIVSGTYDITSNDDGIRGKDSVYIVDGNLTINSKADGIKSTNDTDSDKGFVYVKNGTFKITSEGDGISASHQIVIDDGNFTINTSAGTSNSEETSVKGVKAEDSIIINGGSFNIESKDDAIHSNNSVSIKAGSINISSSDDGIHADGMVEINDGTIKITSAEGIEGTYVKINGGTISINASDDGINANSKSDLYTTKVEINGGNITINMGQGDTDGVDSNGDIIINGGTISVTGQSTFDYDGEGTINGGTVICNGKEVTTLPNQFMGGGQMQNGGGPRGGRW